MVFPCEVNPVERSRRPLILLVIALGKPREQVVLDEIAEGNVFAALRVREADLEKHIASGQGAEQKDETREKAREEARKKLDEKLRSMPEEELRLPPSNLRKTVH